MIGIILKETVWYSIQ